MEFLNSNRGNAPHITAHKIFLSNQYTSNYIDASENLKAIDDIEAYLQTNNLDSEKIIYVKKHLI
jgi:hypothetical protein